MSVLVFFCMQFTFIECLNINCIMFFSVCVLGLNVLLFVCTWVSMLVFFCMQSELIGNLNINCIMFFCVCSRFKDIVKSWIWTIFHNIRLRKMVDISNYGFFRALNPFPKSNWGSGEGRGVFPLFSLTSIILDLEGWLIYQTMGFSGRWIHFRSQIEDQERGGGYSPSFH